jgi:hypothetical protein
VIAVAVSLCRIYHWCKDAFPTSRLKGEWAADVWREACEKTGGIPDLFIQSEDSELESLIPTQTIYILDLYLSVPRQRHETLP